MTETRLDELTRISIHALREESDGVVGAHYQKVKAFESLMNAIVDRMLNNMEALK